MSQNQVLSQASNKIFSEDKKTKELLINGEKIKPELRSILKEQAHYLKTSQIYEVLNDTLINEANDLALNKSNEWDHVLYAKALRYWIDVLDTMVIKLSK